MGQSTVRMATMFLLAMKPIAQAEPSAAPRLRYQPVENGYQIVGSSTQFNRALYDGHSQDDRTERYFTFAGDAPIVMGAITDWRKEPGCKHAKCGVFMAGLSLTPGLHLPLFSYGGETDGDRAAQWFHESPGTMTTFRNGWMEHDIRPFFQAFPDTRAFMEVLPLDPEDGFLVHLRVRADQRVNLVMGFGGITDFLGRLDYWAVKARNFSPNDCVGNTVTPGRNRALLRGESGPAGETKMWIGATLPVNVSIGNAVDAEKGAGFFFAPNTDPGKTPMVRMGCAIAASATWDGCVVVLRNADESALDRWLGRADAVEHLKGAIRRKQSAIEVSTPDRMLNLTVPPSVLAMDACWHKNTFCHGAYGWHCPYMGWRNWYGPTVIGWHERVAEAVQTHAATQVTRADGPERVVPAADGTYNRLENSFGYIPEIPDGRKGIFYNMQEVYVDHFLHHLEWTGDLRLAGTMLPVISAVLDWERRILDPEGDGLYQNWLNTWVSDAHSYNGGGCAQSSAYNYRANRTMARLAPMLNADAKPFADRAERIRAACQKTLWLPDNGVMAEYVDTIGNRLIHPSPELATIYHSIEAGLVDPFQAYQMLRFTETVLRNERSAGRGGRLVWSSEWYPQNYSSCGLYPAENMHLAQTYFACGQIEKGHDLLTGIVDGYFYGDSPGASAHCMTSSGYTRGTGDFSDVVSMHLRLVVEGLFGVRVNLLEKRIEVGPNFPANWDRARLKTRDVTVEYGRKDRTETLKVASPLPARRVVRLGLRAATVEAVHMNGRPAEYRIEPAIGRSCLIVEADPSAELVLTVAHGKQSVPLLQCPPEAAPGHQIRMAADPGATITEYKDPSLCLASVRQDAGSVEGTAADKPGGHTVFVRIKKQQWDGWLPADFSIKRTPVATRPSQPSMKFVPVNIASQFNATLTELHNLKYESPRPKGYSIMCRTNGRFGWDWNQRGYNKVVVDDKTLRRCGGVFTTPSGLTFPTPADGPNAACVSIWDNFPDDMSFALSGKGRELAVFMIGVTNPMQSRVENGRFVVEYADGGKEEVILVNPVNFDDWLNASLQTENETVYFSDYNHGMVQRIPLDPSKELKSLNARAVANEVIIGILGLSVCR